MHRMMIGAAAAALWLAAGAAMAQAPAAAPAAPAADTALTLQPVKPGVFMVVGNGGNTTVVVGKDGLIVVDTKNPGPTAFPDLMDKIKAASPLPVKDVIITHHHADHSGNSAGFEAAGVPVIAHEGEKKALETYNPAGRAKPVAPTKTYAVSETVKIDGVTAEVHHFAAGHTAGDSIVYFPAQKLVSGGDEIVAVTPNVDYPFGGSVLGWLQSLDAIAKLDFDTVIPGHGPKPLTRAEFMAYKQKWETLVQRGRAAVKAGVTEDKILAAIKVDDLGWTLNPSGWPPARLDPFYAELSK